MLRTTATTPATPAQSITGTNCDVEGYVSIVGKLHTLRNINRSIDKSEKN